MNTEITMKDLAEASKLPVVLASAYDSKSGKKKELAFIPYELKYRIIFESKFERTTTSERHPHDALEAYNALKV